MVTTVRKNIFETNSSSSHSITIQDGDYWDTIEADEYGMITLTGGQFGWEWVKYNDALTKANYCAVNYIHNDDKLEMLKEVIMEYTGCKRLIIDISKDWEDYNCGYIDHQSSDTVEEAFDSKDQLKTFIFNKSSWLYLGNDNDDGPIGFYE